MPSPSIGPDTSDGPPPVPPQALSRRLLDPEHMLGVFRRVLPTLTERTIRVERCKGKPVRSNQAAREGKHHFLFKVWIEAGAALRYVLLGVAPVTAGYLGTELEERSRAVRDHPLVRPFCRLGTYVDDLQLALRFFPLDPMLPGLADITGTDGARLLAPHLPACRAGAQLARVECEIAHYKPFERAVLRMRPTLSGSPGAALQQNVPQQNVYVKLFADDRGAASHGVLTALWAAARESSCLRLPEPLGYDPGRRMLIMSEVPGVGDLKTWIRSLARGKPLPAGVDLERVNACVLRAARVVRDLQRSNVCTGELRTFQGELAKLRSRRARLCEVPPEARLELANLDALLQRLESLTPVEERLVPSHGSYRHKQMIGDEHTLALVDWDGFCLADPALDAGTLLGLLLRPGGAPALAELADGFRREILELQPDVGTHLALYEGLALTKRVLSSFESMSRGKEMAPDTGHLAAAAVERLALFEAQGVRSGAPPLAACRV